MDLELCIEVPSFPVVLVVTSPPASAGDVRDVGAALGWGRSPEGGHGNPLQYSCPENPMNRGAWQATVRRAAKIQTQLKRLSMHTKTGYRQKK